MVGQLYKLGMKILILSVAIASIFLGLAYLNDFDAKTAEDYIQKGINSYLGDTDTQSSVPLDAQETQDTTSSECDTTCGSKD